MTKINIKIDRSGNATVQSVCGAGSQCKELTFGLEKRIGTIDQSSRADHEDLYQGEVERELKVEQG